TTYQLQGSGAWTVASQTPAGTSGPVALTLQSGGTIEVRVQVKRVLDAGSGDTYLHLTSVALNRSTGEARTSETVLKTGGAPFPGLEYGFLTNNVNCTFCHAEFDTVTRAYPGMGVPAGQHERIKVASLEALQIRADRRNLAKIAGTLYAVGAWQNKDGTPLTPADTAAVDIKTVPIDPTTGKLVADDWSVLTDLVDGKPTQTPFASFYKGYTNADTFDGEMPASFPPVIDPGADKLLDDTEWQSHLTAEKIDGKLEGGVITKYADAPGSYTPAGDNLLPRTGGVGVYNSNINGPRENVILIGTKADPIRLNGDVGINGDVIISGYVEGDGLLLARGNVYIVGDLIYNDGDTNGDGTGLRTFGKKNDGTKNTWAIAAAGNILHGNFNMDKNGKLIEGLGTNGGNDPSGSDGGLLGKELGLFNRLEWAKTQQYVGVNPNIADPANPGAWGDPNALGGLKGPTLTDDPTKAMTYTANDLAAGRIPASDPRLAANGGTLASTADLVGQPILNTVYTPGYKPRYYSVKDPSAGGKIFVFNTPPSDPSKLDKGAWWDNTSNNGKGQWKGKESGKYSEMSELTGLTPGVDYVPEVFNPANDWFDPTDLLEMYRAEDAKRKADGGVREYEVDGLLYTNNAIFLMARRAGSNYANSSAGQIRVNGGIVAADTGILAGHNTRGLLVNYDKATSQYLRLTDDETVALSTVVRREF
ncbi:MAG: hypothetical protein D6731_07310, partial [Planctomycetota bacterium]